MQQSMNCDPLTGLLHRSAFFDALTHEITESGEKQSQLALLIINIDRFHTLNIAHGFSQADLLVKQLANRLNEVKRKQDIAGRISQDEFAVILPDLHTPHVAELAASKIIKSFEKTANINNAAITVKATAGITICTGQDITAEQLLLQADTAVRLARQKHRQYLVAEISLYDKYNSNQDLERDLENAIANSQLELYYQPKINLNTRQLCGAEALVRWNHPEKGIIKPDQFIPLAEGGSNILPLTLWTLNCALHQTKYIREIWPDFRVAVNLSAGMLDDDNLVELVIRALNTWDTPAEQLVLEITESAVMQNREASMDNLMQLHEYGISMSIDDFGTGYSSLSYLKRLPVKELKIDKSFIKQILTSEADTHIVQAIIDVGHTFNLDILAEGIESAEVIDLLITMGCEYGQGYWFSPPLSYHNFLNWIARSDWAAATQASAGSRHQYQAS
jgi:diguanylate cyclase (GGDEF)-like protein